MTVTLSQTHFRVFNDDGSEAADTAQSPEDVAFALGAAPFVLRVQVYNSGSTASGSA